MKFVRKTYTWTGLDALWYASGHTRVAIDVGEPAVLVSAALKSSGIAEGSISPAYAVVFFGSDRTTDTQTMYDYFEDVSHPNNVQGNPDTLENIGMRCQLGKLFIDYWVMNGVMATPASATIRVDMVFEAG